MSTTVRLQLSRKKGFDLQALSLSTNGLPARTVTRPGLYGNIFKVTADTPAKDAVRSFRRFLAVWSDTQIIDDVRTEDGAIEPMGGIALLILRNKIRANVWRLRGHNLACFCREGAPCHADVYLDFLTSDRPERWKAKYPALCQEVRR